MNGWLDRNLHPRRPYPAPFTSFDIEFIFRLPSRLCSNDSRSTWWWNLSLTFLWIRWKKAKRGEMLKKQAESLTSVRISLYKQKEKRSLHQTRIHALDFNFRCAAAYAFFTVVFPYYYSCSLHSVIPAFGNLFQSPKHLVWLLVRCTWSYSGTQARNS